MTVLPEFIDNRDGNTLARALSAVPEVDGGEGAEKLCDVPDEVRIATVFFNPTGFAQIADSLRRMLAVRLLLGADLAELAFGGRRILEEREAMFERRRMRAGLDLPRPRHDSRGGRPLGAPLGLLRAPSCTGFPSAED